MLKSDSYVDLDINQDFELEILEPLVKEENYKIHEEDQKALNEESLFK